MLPLIVLPLIVASLTAQSPPVGPLTHFVTYVGHYRPQVNSGQPGEQAIVAYCEWQHARPSSWHSYAQGVALGGAIYWQSTCSSPGSIAWFLLAPYDAAIDFPLPFAATNHGTVFVDPMLTVAVWPEFAYSSGGADYWLACAPVPNVPALIGTEWMAQAFRIDPLNGGLYLSDGLAVEVRP